MDDGCPVWQADVQNNLENPCLQATLDSLIANDLNNRVSTILHDVFGENSTMVLKYVESNTLSDSLNGQFRTELSQKVLRGEQLIRVYLYI